MNHIFAFDLYLSYSISLSEQSLVNYYDILGLEIT